VIDVLAKPYSVWNSSIFWLITRRTWFETDVSGLPIGPIFKGETVQEEELISTAEEA
jgi:hypothetical protein